MNILIDLNSFTDDYAKMAISLLEKAGFHVSELKTEMSTHVVSADSELDFQLLKTFVKYCLE